MTLALTNLRTHLTPKRALAYLAAALALLALGAVAGIVFAAPNTVDIRNACVAHDVVPYAGLRPGTETGPVWQSRAPVPAVN